MIDKEKSKNEVKPFLDELKKLLGKDDREIQKAISLIEWNNYKLENPDAVHS